MRQDLEQRLRTMKEIAADKPQTKRDTKKLDAYQAHMDRELGAFADDIGSTPQAQRLILEQQVQKQSIMRKLHARLREVGTARERMEKDARRVTYRNGAFICHDGDTEIPTDLGSILTDGEWGIRYALDPATVPSTIRKRYIVEETKRELRELLDWQVLTDELSRPGTHTHKLHAYEQIAREKGSDHETAGHIAEKMVRTFIQKLAINHELDFEVVAGDPYHDVELKIDFILKRTSHIRAVGVQDSDQPMSLGIQFTTKTASGMIEQKQRQLERAKGKAKEQESVVSIVLVDIPLIYSRDTLKTWQKRGCPPGGPTAIWDHETKALVFKGVLKNFATTQELEAWQHLWSDNPAEKEKNPFSEK